MAGNALSADKVEIKPAIQDLFCERLTTDRWDVLARNISDFQSFATWRYPENSLSELMRSIDCHDGLNPLQYTAFHGAKGALRLMVEEFKIDVNIHDWDEYTVRDYVQNQINASDGEFQKARFQAFMDFQRYQLNAEHSAKWLQENG